MKDYHGKPLDLEAAAPGSTTYALCFLADIHLGALVFRGCSTLVSHTEAERVLGELPRDDGETLSFARLIHLCELGAAERRRLMLLDPHWGPKAVDEIERRVATRGR